MAATATATKPTYASGIAGLPLDAANDDYDYMGSGGIGTNLMVVAEKMAEQGRYGDDMLAHLESGELVVPKDILKASPELQELIFAEMRLQGVEDPERYVAGSDANSINPVTGQAEFFLKKVFKAVTKPIKSVVKVATKVVKSVGKVLKKVAPVVLPIALAMTPLGAVYGAALGSGIGTLLQGGSLKDAVKSGLISGALGGLTAGIGSKMSGGTFTGGVKAAVANPGARFSQAIAGATPGSGQAFFSDFVAPGSEVAAGSPGSDAMSNATTVDGTPTTIDAAKAQATDVTGTPVNNIPANQAPTGYTGAATGSSQTPLIDPQTGGYFQDFVPQSSTSTLTEPTSMGLTPGGQATFTGSAPVSQSVADAATLNATANPRPSFFDRAGDYMFRGGRSEADIARDAMKAGDAYMASTPAQFQTAAGYEAAKASAAPGLLARFGPSTALAAGAAVAGGMFDVPEGPGDDMADEANEQFEGTRYFEMTPEERMMYQIRGLDPNAYKGRDSYIVNYGGRNPYYDRANIVRPTQFSGFGGGMKPSVRYAAAGGEMQSFPRRMGHIMGPGTGTSDDVPAMLSDGEFVMTAQAVRGAGNGSRKDGVRNMMNMMKNFEMRAV